ncbi:epoxyqueuosine reductase [Dysgonomonas sp. BGC7]|uniref:epoxyqueuosine reductase n=1 Tax=Dysgonomonas sp. BGC7 TaxID=1658008 RepID=UPI0006819094|nr:epoxyqueuosine reductase [Dysgonomonas sp. BGC7]MBD8388378.1 epoxyqueuosine reductase [Dysgonomonas sp. BGC7]
MSNKYTGSKLKKQLTSQAKLHGIDLIGFASVDRWVEYNEMPECFFPQKVFPFTRTVIVLALPIFIPMLDTTPSVVYSELYTTSNRLLDEIAYKTSLFLNNKGFKSVFFPRDAYGDISVLIDKPEAAFSHVFAGKYAGLGTIGYNHTLLTKKYGPRVRLVSVFTDAEIESDSMYEEELCVKCLMCKRCCPTSAFTTTKNLIADMDKRKCAAYHAELKQRYTYPCGVCIKVCPIGEDRKIYGMNKGKYLKEKNILTNSEEYSDWVHIRNYGSK